jgi:hypothetical protein
MVSHRMRQPRAAVVLGLLRSYRDLLILSVCVVGLLASWLVYGVSAAGSTSPVSAGEAAGTVLSSRADDRQAWAGLPWAEAVRPEPAPAATAPADEPAAPLADGGAPVAQPAFSFPAASAPQRIIYPAAGMDVAVHPLEPGHGDTETQSIVPPETMDGYWLTPFGTPGTGSANTTYVIGHSWEGLDAPFNHLSSSAAAGNEFSVITAAGSMTYRVESVTTYTKTSLKDSPIWEVVPNRMVLISCYTEDPWGKNVTVVASPVPG